MEISDLSLNATMLQKQSTVMCGNMQAVVRQSLVCGL
jgi:hypothetical protein